MADCHLVAADLTSDRILARLARALLEGTDWTAGRRLDPSASVNYLFPYLELNRVPAGFSGDLAAWFTHRDDGRPAKVLTWDRAAERAGRRLTSARRYQTMLESDGRPAALVRVPVDVTAWTAPTGPGPRTGPIGTSGWVYPGGRKGEHLWRGLRENREATLAVADEDWSSVGEGWDAGTRHLAPGDLAAWVASLRVYVCTSTIEGIGLGPLEALASGVPIVVPTSVGVFDELPDLPGIYRYVRTGDDLADLPALQGVLEAALARRLSHLQRRNLRAVVAEMTPARWVADHLAALAPIAEAKPATTAQDAPDRPRGARTRAAAVGAASAAPGRTTGQPSPTVRRPGVVTVAYGEPARDCAARLLDSLAAVAPGLPVAVVAEEPLGRPNIIHIVRPDSDIGGRWAKLHAYSEAPADWDRVLYLDADTEVLQPLDALWAILDDHDLIIAPNPARYALVADSRRPDNADEIAATERAIGTGELLQYNGGVIGYRRSERVDQFAAAWREEWQRWGKRDQAAFDRALWRVPLRVWLLSSEFNRIDRYDDPTPRTVIAHHPTQARRHVGIVDGRLDSPGAWMSVGTERDRRRRGPG